MAEEIIIIGGGLAGLTSAYALKKKGFNPLVLEADSRLGGRIFTKCSNSNQFELGATWVFQDDVLKQLIEELGLDLYPQYLAGDALIKYDPSMSIQKSPTDELMNGAIYHKVKCGTGAIINTLKDRLDGNRVVLNAKVVALNYQQDNVILTMENGLTMEGAKVILAVPPKVISEHIQINPKLESQYLMSETHTWMGESAKFTVVLDKDYWRNNSLSGFVFSNYGLIREMQDHITDDENFGLMGFLQPKGELVFDFNKRKQVVILELMELFGIQEESVLAYDDCLWGEYFMDGQHKNYNRDLMPHQNNGHPFYQNSHFGDRLYFAGAETSATNPGYMEGAVKSAYRVVNLILESLKN